MSHNARTTRHWALAGVLGATAVVLTACSSSSSTTDTSAAASTTQTAVASKDTSTRAVPTSAAAPSTAMNSNAIASQIDSLAAQCVSEIKETSASDAPATTCTSKAGDNVAPTMNDTGAAAGELCQKLTPRSVPKALGSFSDGQIGDSDALGSPAGGPMLDCSWNLSSDGSYFFYFSVTDIRQEPPNQQASYTSGSNPGSVTQGFPDGSTGNLELGTLGLSSGQSDDWYYRGWPDHWEIQVEVDNGETGDTIWTKAAPQITAELHGAVAS